MKTVIVSGGIGSGKSEVCRILRERGVPVYDCDSRAKDLYDTSAGLLSRIEAALGAALRDDEGRLDRKALAAIIFKDPAAREKLESLLYPALLEDFRAWRQAQEPAPWVCLESALILSKPIFDGVADAVVWVDAPVEVRLQRAMRRDGATRDQILSRMAAQEDFSAGDLLEARDDLEQGALAAARRAQHADEFALADVKCHILQRVDDACVADVVERDLIDPE